ncbi:MFS general substrate transporter [Aulographum hederae CBS 113979]|uniref:MFS general substrate transporter n=1 Tax=Aulographum hederae CBS 113979 TaxID=1176131 RepID=A0A6G1H4C0_9PEZI|nr:MFS general substrate transporter [Aulographum hederae CBS 113979]
MEPDIEKQQSAVPDAAPPPKDPNLIDWDGPDDPGNPMNWSYGWKWVVTLALGISTYVVTFASSVYSAAVVPTAKEFGVSPEVTTLGVSLFVIGFAVGPIIWGPASELYGRRTPLFIGYFLFAVFQIPIAVAVNLETIMLCRFFGGVFGAAPLAIVGGSIADMWDPVNRGIAVSSFSCATFIGPVTGPIIGGFTVMNPNLGWRWTAWFTLIMAAALGIAALIIVPETYAPIILHRRATKIRYETKNWAIRSRHDEHQIDMNTICMKYMIRPFAMLATEPILLLVTLYMSLVYGILYLFFEAYPIAFQEARGWSPGVGALPFISLVIGVFAGAGIIAWTSKTRFARLLKERGHVVPEERLLPMILGAAVFPAGLFWFAWTSNPHINWVPQVLSGGLIGMGILLIFLQGLNYIIDVYLINANSAIAANTFMRSFVAGGFPMFATGMFHNLGIPWATSLLGFLSLALFPVPILFYIYGERIRKSSKYVPA